MWLKKTVRVQLCLVWVVSLLACWWVDLYYFPATTLFPDEKRFLASAANWLSNGNFMSNGGYAWEMPLPSMCFALLHQAVGGGEAALIQAIRVAQSFLLLVQSWLVWQMTRKIFTGDRAAFLAAAITPLYPFLIFYQALALSETIFNTLLLATFAALYTWREKGCRVDWWLIAVMILAGLATYAKASLALLPPLLLAIVAWSGGHGRARSLAILVVGVAVYSAVLAPWWVRNYLVFEEFVPFTTSSAANFYLGNNAANRSGGNDWSHDSEINVVDRINALPNELDQQAAYAKAARDFVTHHPRRFLELAWCKFKRYWSVTPNAEGYNSGGRAAIAALSFGPVLVLSLLGLALNRQYWRALLPIYLLIAYFTLLHTLTIASLRYRLPLEPFLIILAAGTASALIERRQSHAHHE